MSRKDTSVLRKAKNSISVIILILLSSCSLGTYPINQEPADITLAQKWYTNSEDDRYYVEFRNDGTLYHKYYQYYGSIGSGLNRFVTKVGEWRYLNEELSSFSIGWDDSVDRHYDIVEFDTEKLIIQKCDGGPVGRGLGDITDLLRTAEHITFEVPEVLLPLMGTWHYEETKDGKSLSFRENNTCTYHYYQDYGGNLTGWVNKSGSWSYDSDDNIISITMSGEITYPYLLDILTLGELYLKLPENRPGGTSMIYSGTSLYK